MEIVARNVNDALCSALWYLKTAGVPETSRNGPVLVAPEPVLTIYGKPTERVLWWDERDANPFFHLMESLWMLAGRDDVEFVAQFASRMKTFSDDGLVLNGAYGHRWRNRFGVDQLKVLIQHLVEQPNTRRAVLTMWGVEEDLALIDSSKDVCCNTQAFFEIRGGALNMTVINRSNDAIWGAYGANAVHFSVLQEFVAAAVGVPVGGYRQFSHNLHLYTELYGTCNYAEPPTRLPDLYNYNGHPLAKTFPLVSTNWASWLRDCENFCDNPEKENYSDPFFVEVAAPMYRAWKLRKSGAGSGLEALAKADANIDWIRAGVEWIQRREAKKNA